MRRKSGREVGRSICGMLTYMLTSLCSCAEVFMDMGRAVGVVTPPAVADPFFDGSRLIMMGSLSEPASHSSAVCEGTPA